VKILVPFEKRERGKERWERKKGEKRQTSFLLYDKGRKGLMGKKRRKKGGESNWDELNPHAKHEKRNLRDASKEAPTTKGGGEKSKE